MPGGHMHRGEVWWAEFDQRRPVVLLSEDEPSGFRAMQVVAPSDTDISGLGIEVAVGVPPGSGQQVLHPVRSPVPGMLGDRPAVLARQLRQQAQHERPGPAPRLHPAEPAPGPGQQLVKYAQPPAGIYARASGHQKIFTCRHKPG